MASIIVFFVIGFIGSFISGMLGIGGVIIKYPMLLYLPPLFGLAAFSAHEVSGVNAVQVFFAALAGVWAYRKDGYLNKSLILYMGFSILAGSLIGSFGSKYLPETGINIVYGVLALFAAVLMVFSAKDDEEVPAGEVAFPKVRAAALAFVIGISAGIIGSGGGFLLVPIMITVLKIPTRMAIASSLGIMLLSSIGTAAGKIVTGQVDYYPALIMVIASVIASPLGAKIGKKTDTKRLRILLAVIISATAVKVWFDIFQ